MSVGMQQNNFMLKFRNMHLETKQFGNGKDTGSINCDNKMFPKPFSQSIAFLLFAMYTATKYERDHI